MRTNYIIQYVNLRTLALLVFYAVVSIASYWLAYELRLDFNIKDFPRHQLDRTNTIGWVVGLQIILLFASGQFDSILSYFRLPDAIRLFGGLFVNALILLSMWYVYQGNNVPPRAVILTYFLISFLAIGSFRVLMRIKSSRGLEDWLTMDTAENVIIIGAGEVGCFLSHRACWQRIVDEGWNYALVAEDDLAVDIRIWPDVMSLIDRHADENSFIRMPAKAREHAARTVAQHGQAGLFVPQLIGLQTVCQVVGRAAARRLLAASEIIDRPVDTFLQMHWITGQTVHTILPNGVSELTAETGGSTIQKKTRTGGKLIPRKVAGPGTESWREAFIVHRDGSGPLGSLLPKAGCSIVQPATGAKSPPFDPWLCQVPALTGPLMAKGRLVGMFYADNADSGTPPDRDQLTGFSHFVQHAQLCIMLLSG
jgi:GR25 family glycosyltransferase involved in LPS biosynthesis